MERITEVTLDYHDLVYIAEQMCREDEDLKTKVGPAQIEYLLFKKIRDLKQVDFFKEEDWWCKNIST